MSIAPVEQGKVRSSKDFEALKLWEGHTYRVPYLIETTDV